MWPWLIALLLMHPDGTKSDIVLTDGTRTEVLATFAHRADGIANARFVPGTRTALVVADTNAVARDGVFGASLLRIEPGRAAKEICKGVRRVTAPLVTSAGRVFVVRGRPGKGEDTLTLEEVRDKSTRIVWQTKAWELWPIGEREGELLVHRAAASGISLVAIAIDSGKARTITTALQAGPRTSTSARLAGTNIVVEHGRPLRIDRVDIVTGAIEPVVTTTAISTTTPAPLGDDVIYQSDRLRLAKSQAVFHEGTHVVDAVAGERATLLHLVEGKSEPTFRLEILTRDQIADLPLPPHRAVRTIGFLDGALGE